MAICKQCNQEMQGKVSCDGAQIAYPDGTKFEPLLFWDDDPSVTHCHDCWTPKGGFHHPGCDSEECPKCGACQIIACSCWRKDEEDE